MVWSSIALLCLPVVITVGTVIWSNRSRKHPADVIDLNQYRNDPRFYLDNERDRWIQ